MGEIKVRKAVITAAGRGTRMYPASQTLQKELFPLVDCDGYAKPTLQIIVEEALASGLEEICIVANPSNVGPIQAHFHGLTQEQRATQFQGKPWADALSDSLDEMKGRLTFLVQERQEGYGHAVYQAKDWVGDEPCAVLLGDHLYRSHASTRCARQMLDVFERHGGVPVSSVVPVPEAELERLGVVQGAPVAGAPGVWQVEAMAEKPTRQFARENLKTVGLPDGKYLCFFGIHIFPPSVFEALEDLIRRDIRLRGEIQLTTAQALLAEQGRYLVSEVQGERYDMGVPEGLIETQIALALHSPFREHVLSLVQSHKEKS